MTSIHESGNWDGWKQSQDGALLGPDGRRVSRQIDLRGQEANFPWAAFWPEGDALLNPHDKVRQFQTAIAAREAIDRAIAGEAEFRRRHGKNPERLGR